MLAITNANALPARTHDGRKPLAVRAYPLCKPEALGLVPFPHFHLKTLNQRETKTSNGYRHLRGKKSHFDGAMNAGPRRVLRQGKQVTNICYSLPFFRESLAKGCECSGKDALTTFCWARERRKPTEKPNTGRQPHAPR